MINLFLRSALACMGAAALVACGGGGGTAGGVTTPPIGGGTPITPVVVGALGAAGNVSAAASSFAVNSLSFVVGAGGATFADRDDDGRGLQNGMTVLVRGALGPIDPALSTGSGTSNLVLSAAELRGPVYSFTTGGSSFNVMGVEVRQNAQTVIDGADGFIAPAPGTAMRVWGAPKYEGVWPNGKSVIVATRLQRSPLQSGDPVRKLVGHVNYNVCPTCLPSPRQIRINDLVIGVSPEVVRGMAYPLAGGALVRIKFAEVTTGGDLIATDVRPYLASSDAAAGDFFLPDATVRMSGYPSNLGNIGVAFNGLAFTASYPQTTIGGPRPDIFDGRYVIGQGRWRSPVLDVTQIWLP